MHSCKKMLGKRIKELRKSKGLTQERLAELVGFEPNHMTKIEAGIHFPHPDKIDNLAEIFNIPIKELFNFEHKNTKQILKKNITDWLENANIADIEYIYKTINNLEEYNNNKNSRK